MEEDYESSDSGSIPTIGTFNSLIDKINQDPLINEINQKVEEEDIKPIDDFTRERRQYYDCETCCDFFTTLKYRIPDTLVFLIIIISFILLFFSIIGFVCEVSISFYSVIMMNYVFFVSSIVSYTMAPIYQSLSGDWLNFSFSFAQVILASPLIAFYIFYILKSVTSLASFISEIPSFIRHVFFIIMVKYKEYLSSYISEFFWNDFDFIYGKHDVKLIFILLGISIGLLILAAGLAYVELCLDKCIILLGSICYLFNTIQIIALILPSYLYFFQILLNIKCKEVKYVKSYINFIKDITDSFKEKSESNSKSELEKTEAIECDSDESDSVLINRINKKNNNEKDDESIIEKKEKKKLIDDSDISDLVDEDKEADDKMDDLINNLLQLVTANDYYCLYHYSKLIAFDKHYKYRKIVLMYIFFLLNLAVIAYDIYKLINDFSSYFLASVIIRILLVPLFSYYNILSVIFHRSKNQTLNTVLAISSILTLIVAVVIIFCFQYTYFYQNKYRIDNLNYVPLFENYTIANEEMMNHPICDYKMFDVSAFDAFGYSLGGYDIKRNETIFDNQMKFFFNENYSSHISYKVNQIDEYFLFIQYYDSFTNTHIFAFRGYNSGPEVAFQLEILAMHYVIPFFEDIVPFYEIVNDNWLNFYTDFLNSFGLSFFENNNLMVKYVNSIINVYNNENMENEEKVLFAGINCGGVLAKIVGTLLHRKSISFISFPIDNDLFEIMFDFQLSYISLVTNVYNVEGFFSDQEPRYATNIGIDMPIFDDSRFCTAGICEINSKTDNVYRTFCTMSEICGKGDRFGYYCENIIGKNDLDTIRESLSGDE